MKKEELIALGVPEDIAAKVADAIAETMKGYVPKARFDEVNGEKKAAEAAVKERDGQLEELKKAAGNAQELQKKIDGMLEENKARDEAHAAEIFKLRMDNAVSAALTNAKALNQKAVRALLDLENVELDENGVVKGLDKQIEALKAAEDSKFLFGSGAPAMKGAKVGEDGLDGPDGRVDFAKMSYEQLAAYLEANPDAKLN